MNVRSLALAMGVMATTPTPLPAADPLDDWRLRSSNTTKELRDVVHGGAKFVAVGRDGTLLASATGETWTDHSLNISGDFYAIAHGNGVFVATGQSGLVATSPDGIQWTPRQPGTSAHLYTVSHGGGLFLTASAGGVVLTSPDGVSWTPRPSGPNAQWEGATYAAGRHVLVGYARGGTAAVAGSTPDLVQWDIAPTGYAMYLDSVIHFGGRFLAVGYAGACQASLDGRSWTSSVQASTRWLHAIEQGNGMAVAAGESGALVTSPNGDTWQRRTHPATGKTFWGLAFGADTFVVVGEGGSILQSAPLPVAGDAPALRIRRESGKLVLSWPRDVAGFAVEAAPAGSKGPWTALDAPVEDTATEHTVRVPVGNGAIFRLRK